MGVNSLPKTVTRQRRACDFWTQSLLHMSPAWDRFLVYNTGLVQYSWTGLDLLTADRLKMQQNRKTKSRKQICSKITVNSLGNLCSESWRRKGKGCGGKDLQKRKILGLEWKSEWVMEYQIIVSMTVGRNLFKRSRDSYCVHAHIHAVVNILIHIINNFYCEFAYWLTDWMSLLSK